MDTHPYSDLPETYWYTFCGDPVSSFWMILSELGTPRGFLIEFPAMKVYEEFKKSWPEMFDEKKRFLVVYEKDNTFKRGDAVVLSADEVRARFKNWPNPGEIDGDFVITPDEFLNNCLVGESFEDSDNYVTITRTS